MPRAHVAGAGDTFSAALALALAAGLDAERAAQVALDAAGIAVARAHTAVMEQQELLQRVSARQLASDHAAGDVAALAEQLLINRLAGRTIVFTNGVFDILHAGHIDFLRRARAMGDVLVVAVNSDAGTRRLKGANRPINAARDRMALLAALDCVDHVIMFEEDEPSQLIRLLRPHLHAKGGDYADVSLPEEQAVRDVGGEVVIVPLSGTHSTSATIDRIVALTAAGAGEVAADVRVHLHD